MRVYLVCLLNCDIGPGTKTFGKSSWLVYSCTDNKSLVMVSAPGSPAVPFYFFLQEGNYLAKAPARKKLRMQPMLK